MCPTARELVDKTPSDEGFTELEPTLNGSGDDPDTEPPSGGGRQAPAGPQNADPEEDHAKCSTCHTEGKPTAEEEVVVVVKEEEEDEDEGVAPNSSVEDGGSLQSSAETEKQRVASGGDAKDGNAAGSQELPGTSPGSQEFLGCDTKGRHDPMLSRSDSGSGAVADGKGSCGGPAPQEKPQGEASGLSEEERRKKTYKAEMKSWLLERMQAPIQGKGSLRALVKCLRPTHSIPSSDAMICLLRNRRKHLLHLPLHLFLTDMLLSSEEKSKKPPMFLCFKLGKPMRKSFAVASSPAHTYGGRGKQPEYWFAVPQER